MKPKIVINLTHIVSSSFSGGSTEQGIYSRFEGRVPTNMIPDIDHELWMDVWEDGHPYGLKVKAVHHVLGSRSLQQEVIVEANLDCGPDEDQPLQDLVKREMESISNDIAPRLARQGFQMMSKPHSGLELSSDAELPPRRKKK